MSLMPRPTAPMVGPGGAPTREWLDYLRGLAGTGDLAGVVKAIEKLQQQVAEIERTPAVAGEVLGIGAIRALGLLADGLVRLDLRELEDAGGGALVKILRDGYGRVAGTSPANTDDLPEGANNRYFPEAPEDGREYARKDGGWVETTGGGVPEAPEDGKLYGRQDAGWVEVPAGGGGGSSAWLNGSGVPAPALGSDGDQYLDTATSDVYAKEAGAWVFKVNIKGAQGIQGPQGIPGPRGGGIVTSTQALLHFDGTSGATAIADSVEGNFWGNVGSAQLSSVRSRFGSTSLRLSNASGRQYVQLPHKPGLNYQLDFTAEGWFWRESATRNTFFSKVSAGSSTGTWYVAAMPDGTLRTVFGTGSFQIFDSAPGQVPVGAWAHIAVSKQGPVVRSFVNGALATTGTLAAQPADMGSPLCVGVEAPDATADRDFLGWADEFRYSSAALYTAAFVPPATAFGLPVSPQFPVYTMANLPPAAGNEFCPIYVTDLTGGGEPCVSDGAIWRRFSDRSVAS